MKKYSTFLVCLLLSFGAWFVFNMSQTFSDVVSVEVRARSNIDGYSQWATGPSVISARCRTTGFKLSRLSRSGRKPRTVDFIPADFQSVEEGIFTIPASSLYKYSAQIFGPGVTVENIISSEVSFRFNKEDSKKLPVVVLQSIFCRPQYMKVGKVKATPDSVYVYGDADVIAAMEQVMTRPVSATDVHADVQGVTRLERQRGIRYSASEISYFQEITRYVEIDAEKKVETRNVPAGKSLQIYPSTVKVKFRCRYPMRIDPAESAVIFVDYNEFSNSISGKCFINADNLNSGVVECIIDPELCDCFEIVE